MTVQAEINELQATVAALQEELADTRAVLQLRKRTEPDEEPGTDTAKMADTVMNEYALATIAVTKARRILTNPVSREHDMIVALKALLGVV